jgi:hypothetical protein
MEDNPPGAIMSAATAGVTMRSSRTFWLLLVWIPIEVVAVAALAAGSPGHVWWWQLGLALDVAVLAAVAIVLEARRGARVPLVRVLRALALGVVVFAVVDRLLGADALGPAIVLAGLAELTVLGIEVGGAARALSRLRSVLRAGGSWLGAMEAIAEAPMLARGLATEACVHAAWWRSLRRRPLPERLEGSFGVMETSTYPMIVLAIAVATALELPVVHLLLSAQLGPGHAGVHVALLLAHVYTIAWLFGDRRLLMESVHRIEGGALVVQLGLRASGRVPLAAIVGARVLPPSDPMQPRKRERGVLRVTPLDAPNVRLELSHPVTLIGLFGLRRTGRVLELHVDEPERLIAAL